MNKRLLVTAQAAVLAACMLVRHGIAAAAPHDDDAVKSHAETLRGQVRSIDYRAYTFVLRSRHNGLVTIDASPSTSVVVPAETGYHGITDIREGDEVRVDLSDSDHGNEAQVIELLRR